jgi:serine/threonine protein kinase
MPLYPFTLRQLLDSPAFVPTQQPETFVTLSHSIAAQLVSATAYLHSQSISHRDINPSNIVIAESGRPLLIDFGIAVELGDEKEGEQHFEIGTGQVGVLSPNCAVLFREQFD